MESVDPEYSRFCIQRSRLQQHIYMFYIGLYFQIRWKYRRQIYIRRKSRNMNQRMRYPEGYKIFRKDNIKFMSKKQMTVPVDVLFCVDLSLQGYKTIRTPQY